MERYGERLRGHVQSRSEEVDRGSMQVSVNQWKVERISLFRIVFSLTSLAIILQSICRKFVLPSVSTRLDAQRKINRGCRHVEPRRSHPAHDGRSHSMVMLSGVPSWRHRASEKFSRRQAALSHDVARLSPTRVCIGSPKAFFGVARRDWEFSCWS